MSTNKYTKRKGKYPLVRINDGTYAGLFATKSSTFCKNARLFIKKLAISRRIGYNIKCCLNAG